MTSFGRWVLVSCAMVTGPLWAAGPSADLGSIEFPTSGSPAAQEHFLHGVLALHSFEYRDARAAFVRAQGVEPTFAMAYWGEAMTYNHPIWLEEDRDAALEALGRLAPTAAERRALAGTAREKAWLASVEILFGEGDKRRRDHAYAGALLAMTEARPDDLEARSFYALALLGTCHDGRDVATYMRAAAEVEEVFDANPRHPGAAHYLIHSYDDPVHAPLGLRAARVYAGIAPAAGHALHMPSHIFLALGMWDETVASNIDSWTAVAERVAAEDLPVDRRNFHALLWWHYGELQRGRYGEARRLLEVMARDAEASGSERTRSHFALMRTQQVVATGHTEGLPEPKSLDDLRPGPAAADRFAAGRTALRAGDLQGAVAALAELRAHLPTPSSEDHSGYSGCGFTRVGPQRSVGAEVMGLQLEALIARARGETTEALVLLGRALETEREAPFGFGPPMPVQPSNELLGEVLLGLDRFDEARVQFETALTRTPRRARSLLGLSRATSRTGDAATAEQIRASLRAIWHQADADLPERAEIGLAPMATSGAAATVPAVAPGTAERR